MTYKISVIIPIYNAKNFLENAVNSILSQTLNSEDIEIILVDDNSNDGTKILIEELAKKHNNILPLLLEENSGGPSKPRNIGIKNANADYIMFLDQDDYFKKDFCEVMYNEIVKTDLNVVGCVFSNHVYNEEKSDHTSYLTNPLEDSNLIDDFWLWNKIYKTSFLREYDIHCPNTLFEDVFFDIQVYYYCGEIKYLPNYCGYYHVIREGNEGISLSNNQKNYDVLFKFMKGLEECIDLIKKFNLDDKLSYYLNPCFVAIFIQILHLKNVNDDVLDYLNHLFDSTGVELEFKELWSAQFYKICKNKNYGLIKLFSRVYGFYFNSNLLKKIHRRDM